MRELKYLKDKWRHELLTIYYVIIQRMMSPRKSEEDVMIKILGMAEAVVRRCFFKIDVLKNFANFTGKNLCWFLFLIKLQA